MITIDNEGADIKSTNYWATENASVGLCYLVPERKVMFLEFRMELACLQLCCRAAELESSGSSDATNRHLPPIRRCSDGSISAPAFAAAEKSRIKVV